ncbi:WD40 repeat-like protein, partial [Calocera cornea HHB12733]
GAQRGITAFAAAPSGTLYVGAYNSRIVSYSDNGTEANKGDGHTFQVTALAVSGNTIFSTGFNDCVREVDLLAGAYTYVPCFSIYSILTPVWDSSTTTGTNGQPKDATGKADALYVITSKSLECIKGGKVVSKVLLSCGPFAVATSAKHIAVSAKDQKVYLFEKGLEPKQIGRLESNKGIVMALAFSPNGSLLAAGNKKEVKTLQLTFHSGQVTSIAWSADGKHAASGPLDTNVYIWSMAKPMKNIGIKNAGAGGISGVAWVGMNIVASTGADGCVRTWESKFHE